MKKLIYLLPVALMLQSCITRIFTSVPTYTPAPTVVATPAPVVTTVHAPAKPAATVQVVPTTYAYAAYLDLQAVAAAFAQSSTVQQFEYLLNNSSIMLSNLDLNRDGYIDYLRVLETVSGYNHVFLIQAVLAYNVYQDVATIIADVPAYGTCYVQVIGAEYIYGPKYIIQPVFTRTPLIYSHLRAYGYSAWRSPYYWNHYPSAYTHPAPMPNTHYTACVSTYMSNNRYCNNVTVVNEYHINNYTTIINKDSRSDYAREHPRENTTTTTSKGGNTAASTGERTTATVNQTGESKRNPTTTTTTTTSTAATSNTAAQSPSKATSVTVTKPSTTPSRTQATTAKTPGTTVSTRISTTGKTTTTTTTRLESGTTTKTVTSSRTNTPTRTTVTTSTATPTRTVTSAPSRTSATTTTAPSRTGSTSSAPSRTGSTSSAPSRTTTTTTTSGGSRR